MSTEQVTYQGCPTIRRRVIGPNVWLLSFGDLVTLLLGFFVAIIAYAMQHPQKASDSNGIDNTGTALAEVSIREESEPSSKLLLIPAQGFDPDTGAVTEFGSNLLKSLGEINLSAAQKVLISSCTAHGRRSEELTQFTGISRTLAIASQLLDRGMNPSRVQVEFVAGGCRAGLEQGGIAITVAPAPVRQSNYDG